MRDSKILLKLNERKSKVAFQQLKFSFWKILCISSYCIILVCNMYTAVEYLLIAVKSQQGYRGNHSTSHILGWLKNYMLCSNNEYP